jgi:hypothetical protein
MEYSWSNNFSHSYSQGPAQDTSSGPYQLGKFHSKFWQKFKFGYFKIGFTKKLHIFTSVYQKLHQACSDYWHGCFFFFQVHADQCAVGMIEKGAGIHVNFGGMILTRFDHQCEGQGLSSNPVVTLFFFSPM